MTPDERPTIPAADSPEDRRLEEMLRRERELRQTCRSLPDSFVLWMAEREMERPPSRG
jgi:hypothetical protein